MSPFASPAAVAVFCSSLCVFLLDLPLLVQHVRARNVGAAALISGVLLASLQNGINALLWPGGDGDELAHRYSGIGICDVESKLQVLIQGMFPASVACILGSLARVMAVDRAGWTRTPAQRRRQLVWDLLCVLAVPALQAGMHFVVQPFRYYVFGIAGCQAATDGSWLAFVLIQLPPAVWCVVDDYYAVLILVRLYRYRLSFRAILESNNTTQSRFLRLYALCVVWILVTTPYEAAVLYWNDIGHLSAYSWSATHPTDGSWNTAVFVRSGQDPGIIATRVIDIVGGLVIFFLFGFGTEAMKTYRGALLSLGLGRVIPALREGGQSDVVSKPGTVSSTSSRSKGRIWSFFSSRASSSHSATELPSTCPDEATVKPDSRSKPSTERDACQLSGHESRKSGIFRLIRVPLWKRNRPEDDRLGSNHPLPLDHNNADVFVGPIAPARQSSAALSTHIVAAEQNTKRTGEQCNKPYGVQTVEEA